MFSLNYLIIAFIAGYLTCAFTVIIGGWFYKIEKGWLDAKSNCENSKYTDGIIKDEEIQRALTNEISGLKWTSRMGINREHAANKIRETVVRGLYDGETMRN